MFNTPVKACSLEMPHDSEHDFDNGGNTPWGGRTHGNAHQNKRWATRCLEQMQFRILFVMVFTWFLFAAVLKSFTLQRASSKDSCWQEARREAYSLTPYAFMRI